MLTSNDTDTYGKLLWEGRPKEVRLSPTKQLTGYLAYGVGISSMAFSIVRTLVFRDASVTPLLLALVSATVGALVHTMPHLWHGSELYRVTQNHVILIRGPFNRVIERGSINFARIYWSHKLVHVGTLELVRAVPMGVFSRRLALRLEGVESPDGVWAIIRGEQAVASSGHESLPIAQRLDRGERILWYARPLPTFKAYLPMGSHQWYQFVMALGLFAFAGYLGVRTVTILNRLSNAGLSANTLPFWSLAVALGTTFISVVIVGLFITHSVVLYRAVSLRDTRYLISNKRVLIQCGREELHLDRRHIVDIIDTPAGSGLSNLFLVLDGPRARAIAASGAFGENRQRTTELLPVFECVRDGEGAKAALSGQSPSLPPLHWAA